MKQIFKKNQIIITALAIMIAVAGYLNYSGSKLGEEAAPTAAGEDDALIEMSSPEEGEEYALNELDDPLAEMDDSLAEPEDPADENDTAEGEADVSEEEVTNTPGEAVLTSTGGAGFAAEARLTREQVRAKNKETLLEVINNTNISDEQKQNAVDTMTAMTDIAEKEAATELLLETKGFADAVVSITDGTADIVINQAEISEAERAQIEDIVKRKTNIEGENIVISPRQ